MESLGVALLLVCAVGNALGREEPVFLSADTTTGRWESGKLIRVYRGRVVIRHGDLTIRADRAEWFEEALQRVMLSGRVSAEDALGTLSADRMIYEVEAQRGVVEGHVAGIYGDREMEADRVTYDWKTGKGFAEGHVRFSYRREGGRDLEADQMIYDREAQRTVAQGHVRLVDRLRRATVTGGYAEYSDKVDSGFVTGGPVLAREDEDGEGAITIRAERMEIASGGKRAVAKGGVHIERGRFQATCEEAFYTEDEGRLILRVHPEVFQVTGDRARGESVRRNELVGDTISVALENNAVRHVTVSGDAEAVSSLLDSAGSLGDRKTHRSFLKGRTISMVLDQERLTEMIVGGHAVSLYDAPPEKGKKAMRTFSTGDTIHLLFEEGNIHRVLIEGGIQGVYYFYEGRKAGG